MDDRGLHVLESVDGNLSNIDGKLLEGSTTSKSGRFNELLYGFKIEFLYLLKNDGSSGGASTMWFVRSIEGIVGIVGAISVLILFVDDCWYELLLVDFVSLLNFGGLDDLLTLSNTDGLVSLLIGGGSSLLSLSGSFPSSFLALVIGSGTVGLLALEKHHNTSWHVFQYLIELSHVIPLLI